MKKSLSLALAFAGAALLGGCQTSSRVDVAQNMPDDYRLRHPIAVREKVQSLTVFIGDARGTLTPAQRADVGALASSWRQEATGGVVIEMPAGSPNEHAAASASREIRSILAASGVPGRAIEIRPYPAQDPIKLGTMEHAAEFPICMFAFSTLTKLRLDQPVFFPGNDRHGIWSSPLLETVYAPPTDSSAFAVSRAPAPAPDDKKPVTR